jgi:hypothetical protein
MTVTCILDYEWGINDLEGVHTPRDMPHATGLWMGRQWSAEMIISTEGFIFRRWDLGLTRRIIWNQDDIFSIQISKGDDGMGNTIHEQTDIPFRGQTT